MGKAVKVCGEHSLKQGSKPIKIYPKRYPINAYITEIILARIPSSKGTKFVGNVLKKILHQLITDMQFTYYLGVIRIWSAQWQY